MLLQQDIFLKAYLGMSPANINVSRAYCITYFFCLGYNSFFLYSVYIPTLEDVRSPIRKNIYRLYFLYLFLLQYCNTILSRMITRN